MGIAQKFSVDEPPLLAPGDFAGRPPSKLLGLELLRFASALAVLFYHYDHFARIPGAAPITRAEIPFYRWLWPLFDYGQFGVELFWGISGYIFFWKYGQTIHAGAVSAGRFFWLRFSRLYPLHFATLILVAGLQMVHRHLAGQDFVFPATQPGQFFSQLVLANNWGAQLSHSFNAPIWSISAEVAVYAGFFFLLRRLAPSLSLCIAVVLLILVMQLSGVSSVPALCAMFFFAGGMAALLPRLTDRQRILAGTIAALMVSAAAAAGTMHDPKLVPWVILGTLPVLLAALGGDLPGFNRWHRKVEAAGNLTYSTYLLHFPLQLLVAIVVAGSGVALPLSNPLFLLAYVGVTLAAAALCYRLFELPAQDWLRRRTVKRLLNPRPSDRGNACT